MKNSKKILEYKEFNDLKEDELLEMSNVTYKTTGIKDIVLWIGPNPGQHWKRIKICNKKNTFDPSDSFILTIPEFEIKGKRNEKVITNEILEKIKEFVKINYQVIYDYSDYKISTEDFIEKLKKI